MWTSTAPIAGRRFERRRREHRLADGVSRGLADKIEASPGRGGTTVAQGVSPGYMEKHMEPRGGDTEMSAQARAPVPHELRWPTLWQNSQTTLRPRWMKRFARCCLRSAKRARQSRPKAIGSVFEIAGWHARAASALNSTISGSKLPLVRPRLQSAPASTGPTLSR